MLILSDNCDMTGRHRLPLEHIVDGLHVQFSNVSLCSSFEKCSVLITTLKLQLVNGLMYRKHME